jgi:hypothetical protein
MLVDFERLEILKQMSILQEISPYRKRKYLYSTDGALYTSNQRFIDFIGYQTQNTGRSPVRFFDRSDP